MTDEGVEAVVPSGRARFAAMMRELEAVPEYRGDGASPQEVLDAFPEYASVRVEDLTIEGPDAPVPARLYRPGADDDGAPGPVRAGLVWVHGGAYVMGTLDMAESHAVGLGLAHRGIAVLALDYRKALRGVRHPALLDDVAAGWDWALENADHLGVPAADLHAGGASAGGTLVTALSMRLRDAGRPVPRSLVLAYSAMHGDYVVDEAQMEQLRQVAPDALFDEEFMHAVVENYTGDDPHDPYAFPGHGDPRGLPPALVLNCEVDSLRFSAEQWADDVAAAGGDVVVELFPGATHGVLDRPATADGRAMLTRMGDWLLG